LTPCPVFDEVLQQKRMEIELKKKSGKLEQNIMELQRANRRILEQQKALVEDERLKVILEMAGASVYELVQPITHLLSKISSAREKVADPEQMHQHLTQIMQVGQRIESIVSRIKRLHPGNQRTVAEGFPESAPLRVLSVEDADLDYHMIFGLLKPESQSFALSRSVSIHNAFEQLEEKSYDLILLDFQLSDGTALDFLNRMQLSGIELPVVVITAHGDEFVAAEVFRAGAYDYLPKEKLSRSALVEVMHNALNKYRAAVEFRSSMKKMAELTIKDELTGLYNRRYCMDALCRELSSARRYDRQFSICVFDIDNFKQINDSHGHLCGDMVLNIFGKLLADELRDSDIPCRFGGEEFLVLLPETPEDAAWVFSERFRKAFSEYAFEYQEEALKVTVSGGIAGYDPDNPVQTPEEIIHAADRALYAAKDRGRNRVIVSRDIS